MGQLVMMSEPGWANLPEGPRSHYFTREGLYAAFTRTLCGFETDGDIHPYEFPQPLCRMCQRMADARGFAFPHTGLSNAPYHSHNGSF